MAKKQPKPAATAGPSGAATPPGEDGMDANAKDSASPGGPLLDTPAGPANDAIPPATEGGDLFDEFDSGIVDTILASDDEVTEGEIPEPEAIEPIPNHVGPPPEAEPIPPATGDTPIAPLKLYEVELPLSPVGRRRIQAVSPESAWECYRNVAGILATGRIPIIREVDPSVVAAEESAEQSTG